MSSSAPEPAVEPSGPLAGVLREESLAGAHTAPQGYLDLLGDQEVESTGPVQDLMVSRLVPQIYERWWRPALGRLAKGILGPGMAEERQIALRMLDVGPGERILDVACGTGAFTRDFARAVGPDGVAVGADVSRTMLVRAVASTDFSELPQTAFVRCDVLELPFRERAFDGVCCFAALNLFPKPLVALDRLSAALAPGGRIAIFTSARGRSTPLRLAESIVERTTGIRMFERGELIDALKQRGFTGVRQRLTGFTQFVGGRLGEG